MVVAATLDLPEVGNSKIIYVDRDFHKKDGVEEEIKKFFPAAKFITIDNLTEGQASTCLLAKNYINNDEEVLIAGCDNGIVFDEKKFFEVKKTADVLVFTFRGNEAVMENPQAYGWVDADENSVVKAVSVKVPLSHNPLKDHAVVSAFWFRRGSDFVKNAEEMISQNDRINGEFYADQVIKYCLKNNLRVMAFEVAKYLCWGTPQEYKNYENTINYWRKFYQAEFMKKLSIIVPCYNESKNIPLIISAFQKAIGKRKNIEVILVNNGSTDDSAAVFISGIKNKIFFKLVNVKKNQGYGFGILSGLEVASGDVLAWTHADMQTDPSDVIRGFDFYQNSADENIFVKGKRKNRAALEFIFTFGMQLIASLVLKTYVDDINAQPKIFSRKFYENFLKTKSPHDFSLDLFALFVAKKNGLKIKEIEVNFAKRIHGEAKGGGSWKTRLKLVRRTFVYIFKLKNNLSFY
jgi:dTDP-glucose pyrophosphorylase